MTKPQLNHLSNLMYGLIVVDGNKSICSVSKAVLSAKDSSSIYKFLSKSEWDDSLINRNRISYLNLVLEQHVKSNSVGFLVIDDTINPKPSAKKMEGLNYHFSHIEGKSVWSHCVLDNELFRVYSNNSGRFNPYDYWRNYRASETIIDKRIYIIHLQSSQKNKPIQDIYSYLTNSLKFLNCKCSNCIFVSIFTG